VRQSADRAFVELATGRVLQARYVVGCDGASSGVREAIGVPYTGATAHAPWLVVDVETDAPLRHLPYFSYICDPARPAVSMPLPGGHRWEWMVLPGEDAAALAAPDSVRALLRADVDPDQVRVVRSAVYAYHARMAASWRQGRVLLAGDAAHCMPPFAGQGFGAGVRDAAALSWRLDEVLRGRCGPELLSGYERERRPHVQSMTRLALLAGRVVQPTAPAPAAAARSLLRVLDRTPGVRGAFRTGRARPAPRLPSSGLPHGARVRRAGSVLPNPRVRTLAGRVRRLDDLLEDGWGLLAAGTDPRGGLPDRFLEWLRVRPVAVLSVVPPGGLRRTARLDCDAVEDLDGTLIRLLARAPAGAVLLARPDRYLVGADTPQQLMGALDALHLAAGPEIR
jgi:3-(3-hydroxy-phenyl)propionate hydroxylase